MALIAVLLAGASGCGKKGPPLPPLTERPQPISGMRIRQIGQQMVLSFERPTGRISGAALGPEASVEISLSRESYGGSLPDNETIWTLTSPEWGAYARGGRLEVSLRLASVKEALSMDPGSSMLSGRRLGFILRVVEPVGRASEPASMPVPGVCDPPEAPSASHPEVMEAGIRLSFGAGSALASRRRLNIYRAGVDESLPESPIARIEVPEDGEVSWRDVESALGMPYRYVARNESSSGCESANSLAVEVTRVDRFPPAPPQGLVAVVEEGAIRLFWRPGREPDLGGYRVWRSDRPEGPFKVITPESIPVTSYTDIAVVQGVAYVYAVTARDLSEPANESSRSEAVSETAGARP